MDLRPSSLIPIVLTVLLGVALPAAAVHPDLHRDGETTEPALIEVAWQEFTFEHYPTVLSLTEEIIDLYADDAQRILDEMPAYSTPPPSPEEILARWPLNDVGVAHFLQGEAHRLMGQDEKARAAYQTVIDEFAESRSLSQDGETFWSPAVEARARLKLMEDGTASPQDLTSSGLVDAAWSALENDDFERALELTAKCRNLYGDAAREQQAALEDFPGPNEEEINRYDLLNDVGICLFIEGEAYRKSGRVPQARQAYQEMIDDYGFAQAWDPGGWFWKPVQSAENILTELPDPPPKDGNEQIN